MLISVFLGISIGFSIYIAHQKGANNSNEYPVAISTLLYSTLFFAMIGLLLVLFFIKPLISVINPPVSLEVKSTIYLKILLIGMFPCFSMMSLGAVLRGFGDSKTPLFMYITGSILNIVLDIVFVGVLKFDIEGAAYGTVIAQFVTSISSLFYVLKRYKVKIYIEIPSFSLQAFKKSISFGLPVAIQYICIAIGSIILVRIVTPLGTALLGAFTVIGRLETFTAMPFLNVSSTLTTYVAQNWGAKNIERIKKGIQSTLGFITVFTAIMSIIMFIFAEQVSSIFTTDNNVIEITVKYLRITSPFLILYTLMANMHGSFNGIGKTQIPLFCTICSFLIIRVPFTYIARDSMGVNGLIWAVVLGWGIGFIYTISRYLLVFKSTVLYTKSIL